MLCLWGRVCVATRTAITIMSKQPVNTSSYAMVKVIEELEKNPYFDKYAAKIAKAQKESPEEFLTKFAKNKEVQESQPGGRGFTQVAEKAKESMPKGAYSFAPQKKLESILKTELLQGKTNEEVAYIWTEHFRNKDAVCGVISAETYEKLHRTTIIYPCFVLPLPRNQGYEFIVVQFAGHEAHLTPLINYQNAFEAQFLVNQLQLYYSGNDIARMGLLEKFNRCTSEFKHMELVEQLESLDLNALASIEKDK